MKTLLFFLLVPVLCLAQSDLDKIVKGGEILLTGLTILKAKSNPGKDTGAVESVCVKNRLGQKITFKLTRTDDPDTEVVKEVIVQNNGRECVYKLPKGIYAYEILLSSMETYKKGEYKLDQSSTFTVRPPE